MKTLKALLLLFFLATQAVFAQGFFYFGNSNLVGTGKTVGTSKEGVWKIYARKEFADNSASALSEVGGRMTNFNFISMKQSTKINK